VNRALEAKARALAALQGYVINPAACPDGIPITADFVIDASTGCSRSRSRSGCPSTICRPRPIYNRTRDSIEAHLTIVFAALAVSRWIEDTTGWSIKKFAHTARRYEPSESRSAGTPSRPPTPCPTTSATPSAASTQLRHALTDKSQVSARQDALSCLRWVATSHALA
jgi:hypothetical protein